MRAPRHACRLAIAAALLAALPSLAATLHVDRTTCPDPGDGSPRAPFCTVQAALALAANGDEVLVAPGTYDEAIDLLGKQVHLRSSDGPDVTVLRHTTGSVVSLVGGETTATIVEGFTIRDGPGTVATNCTGGGLQQGLFGGGMYIVGSSATVRDCVFLNNGNATGNAIASGAAIYVTGGDLVIHGSRFSGNGTGGTGTGYGMGVTACGETATLTVLDSVFDGNGRFDNTGGGIHAHGSELTVERSEFLNNTASFGGGIHVLPGWSGVPSVARISDCTFRGNLSNNGGGFFSWTVDGSHLDLLDSVFVDNDGGSGGGARILVSAATATIARSDFHDNVATFGGGIFMVASESARVTASDLVVVGNRAVGSGDIVRGGGITAWIDLAGSIEIANATVLDNTADFDNGGIDTDEAFGGTVIVKNSILRGNLPDQVGGPGEVTHCNVEGGYGGTANFDADPLFVDAARGNYRLRPGSPCIDVGTNPAAPGAVPDRDGEPRFVDDPDSLDGDGPPVVDLGAFEHPHGNLLRLTTSETLAWREIGGAEAYSVYRGNLTPLLDDDGDGLPDPGYGECLLDADATDTVLVDAAEPGPGTGFLYLVAAVDDEGTEHFLGATSAGLPRQVGLRCP